MKHLIWILIDVIYIDDGNGQVCISEIVPGSIAHRSGTLKIGDTLLAVNNKSLSDCTRQEASDILQEAGDVVTLRVRTSNGMTGNANSHFWQKTNTMKKLQNVYYLCSKY